MSRLEEGDMTETMQDLLEDMETIKKRVKHLEEQVIRLRSGKKWL
jgi:chaperonin cofactor prefoldin